MFSIIQPLFLQKKTKPLYPHKYQTFIWDWDLNLGSKEFSLGVSVVRGFSESKKKWCEPVSKDLNVPTALIKYLRAAVMVEVHTMYLDCGLPNIEFPFP